MLVPLPSCSIRREPSERLEQSEDGNCDGNRVKDGTNVLFGDAAPPGTVRLLELRLVPFSIDEDASHVPDGDATAAKGATKAPVADAICAEASDALVRPAKLHNANTVRSCPLAEWSMPVTTTTTV